MLSLTLHLLVVSLASYGSCDSMRLCKWQQPRTAVIRDTLYLDGGRMWQCQWDDTASAWDPDPHFDDFYLANKGIVFELNFNKSFPVNADFVDLFGNWTNGPVASNPAYRSGFMFADDFEFYTFGGTSLSSDGINADLLNDQIWKPSGSTPSTIQNFQAGLNNRYAIPADCGVDRYITHGAGVNIPSQYLGYYFSGLEAAGGGYMEDAYANDSVTPNKTVDQMIKIDMSMMGSAEWTSFALDPAVPGRGGAELAFIPRGDLGLLIAIGGVPIPVDSGSRETTFIEQDGALLMTDLSVFDIASGKWYSQSTSGAAPPKTAGFCTVVAHQNGTKSYQIYAYGGYDGSELAGPVYNSVWILSVPSFQWTNATPPESDRGRFGHVCAMPYPDQMLVVGGSGLYDSQPLPGANIVQLLNLSCLEWLPKYDPAIYSDYIIPGIVSNQGDLDQKADGMDPTLAALFDKEYSMPIETFYPYKPTSGGSHSSLAPAIGGALGGVALVVSGFFIGMYVRKKKKKKRGSSDSSGTPESQATLDGVDEWRNQVKSTGSTAVMEIASSNRSTVLNDAHEPHELGGGHTTTLLARSPMSSPSAAHTSSPRSPRSNSVEVSGEPFSRPELQDTSPRQRAAHHLPSPQMSEPDYNLKNHPLFPLNVTDAVSVAETPLTTEGADTGSSPSIISHQAALRGPHDDFEQFVYGGAPAGLGMSSGRTFWPEGSDRQSRHHQQIPFGRRMTYDDMYPGDALPSPSTATGSGANELPAVPRHGTTAAAGRMGALEMGSGTLTSTDHTSPLPLPDSRSNTAAPASASGTPEAAAAKASVSPSTRPTAHRNQRSLSSEISPLMSHGLPSPDLEEDTRRSDVIEALPDSPTETRAPSSSAVAAAAGVVQDRSTHSESRDNDNDGIGVIQPLRLHRAAAGQGVRRKEVGAGAGSGAVARSAYEETRMRLDRSRDQDRDRGQ